MLASLYRHRSLLRELIVRELNRRSEGSGLGLFWTVLHPLLILAIFSLVFGKLMAVRMGEGATPFDYFVYLCSGLVPWFAVQDAIHRASGLFIENAGLVKKVAFPPVLLAGQVVGSAVVTLLISSGLLVGFLAVAGRPPVASLVLLLPATGLLVLLVAGLVMALSVLNVFFRDLGQLVPVATTLWFWLSPVVYTPSILPESLRPLLLLNPLMPILDLFRRGVGRFPDPSVSSFPWPGLAVIAMLAIGGFLLFRGLVRDVPDEI